ncbi:flagellar FlbD family protein [Clostridium akagii]|uniref:flagellar FlbD family protein n=1 Tax=Clostridium akagii TaxID=91623 RepID=UPI0004795D98|nr:flagellar FlbD family protein [Clostridium akagii]
MIRLTGLNHKEVVINASIIEKIEEVPETVITLLNGNKYLVEESIDEVIDKIIEFKKRINNAKY